MRILRKEMTRALLRRAGIKTWTPIQVFFVDPDAQRRQLEWEMDYAEQRGQLFDREKERADLEKSISEQEFIYQLFLRYHRY